MRPETQVQQNKLELGRTDRVGIVCFYILDLSSFGKCWIYIFIKTAQSMTLYHNLCSVQRNWMLKVYFDHLFTRGRIFEIHVAWSLHNFAFWVLMGCLFFPSLYAALWLVSYLKFRDELELISLHAFNHSDAALSLYSSWMLFVIHSQLCRPYTKKPKDKGWAIILNRCFNRLHPSPPHPSQTASVLFL